MEEEEKVIEYLKTLYPECDVNNLTEEQMREKEFIEKHMAEIDEAMESVVGDALEFGVMKSVNDATILKRAIYYVSEEVSREESRAEMSEVLSGYAIGKTVVGKVSTEKQKEAEEVENNESINREGEELGHGN